MESVGKLEPQDWMTAPETVAVVEALSVGGREVRFVGGCVRDAVAGRPVTDVDIATTERPETVIALLEDAGLKAVPTGIDHGTVTAVSDGRAYEVTSLREDVETYGRHARVAFTDDWLADAARRDLTINALSCAPDGRLYDPFGGLADIEAGRVRFVGDARERIEEDHLRLLRFFRFHAHYGRGAFDPDGLKAAVELAPRLKDLSGERVRDELLKLLRAPNPVPALEVMLHRRLLEPVLPEAGRLETLARLIPIEPDPERPDELRRLAAVLETDGAGAERVGRRLRLPKSGWTRLRGLMEKPPELTWDSEPVTLRRCIYRLGAERAHDLLLLDFAHREPGKAQAQHARLKDALALLHGWHAPSFPLRGRDAQALGVPKGPEVGRLLEAVEDWWIAEDFAPDRAACLERLGELARTAS